MVWVAQFDSREGCLKRAYSSAHEGNSLILKLRTFTQTDGRCRNWDRDHGVRTGGINDRDQVNKKITGKGSLVALRTLIPGLFWDEALNMSRDDDVEADHHQQPVWPTGTVCRHGSCLRDLLQHVADCNHILLHYDAPPDIPHHFIKNPYSIKWGKAQ
jgi:hypothetical protein